MKNETPLHALACVIATEGDYAKFCKTGISDKLGIKEHYHYSCFDLEPHNPDVFVVVNMHPDENLIHASNSKQIIHVTVQAGDLIENSSTSSRISEITSAMENLLQEKNKRYGDSAINPRNRFSKLSGSEGIKIRLDDKMNRIENSGELRINDVADMIGYLTLYLVAEGVRESDILKLID